MNLPDTNQDRLSRCLQRLTQVLIKKEPRNQANLMQGSLGYALFWANYYKLTGDSKHADLSIELLEQAFEIASNSNQLSNLGTGFTGLCWTVKQLIDLEVLDSTAEEILTDTDPLIIKSISVDFKAKNYDLFYGYIGKLLYLKSRNTYRDELQSWLKQISILAKVDEQGRAWWEDVDSDAINLGLAHGVPSLMLVLAQIGDEQNRERVDASLLDKALAFILTCRLFSTESLYPTSIQPSEEPTSSRLAWCHGDLGIAYALLFIGRLLDHAGFLQAGIDAARMCVSRPLEKSGVQWDEQLLSYDCGWCHGTAGNAYLFGQLAQLLPESVEMTRAYEYWLELTVSNLEIRLEILDKQEKHREEVYESFRWEPEFSLLQGIAGAGLVLISALKPELSDWSQLFLLHPLQKTAVEA